MNDADCVRFLQWCLPRLRMRWAGFRKVRRQVCRRIDRRLRELRLVDADAYRARLQDDAGEWAVLDGLCRITISRFFRDRGVFDALGRDHLPSLAREACRRGEGRVACWSAGCASGEEVYSLTILWALRIAPQFPDVRLHVLGTDSDPRLLDRAARACYPPGALREVPDGWLAQAFEPSERGWRVRAEHRAAVELQQQDVRSDAPPGPFDIVLCRNLVFTYFEDRVQREVLARVRERLRPDGILVVGGHETLPAGERVAFTVLPGGAAPREDGRS